MDFSGYPANLKAGYRKSGKPYIWLLSFPLATTSILKKTKYLHFSQTHIWFPATNSSPIVFSRRKKCLFIQIHLLYIICRISGQLYLASYIRYSAGYKKPDYSTSWISGGSLLVLFCVSYISWFFLPSQNCHMYCNMYIYNGKFNKKLLKTSFL